MLSVKAKMSTLFQNVLKGKKYSKRPNVSQETKSFKDQIPWISKIFKNAVKPKSAAVNLLREQNVTLGHIHVPTHPYMIKMSPEFQKVHKFVP